jgi:hypothetical protein
MIRIATAVILATASPAAATEIFEAEGAWVGEGLLATGAEAPLERGRCRVEIAPDPEQRDVSVTGSCAVAAGVSDISLRILRSGDARVNAGFWSAATGQTVQFSGTEIGTAIEMQSTTVLMVDETPYESRVSVSAPDAESFAIRQLLRAEGAEAWRLVVDMTYRKAGG